MLSQKYSILPEPSEAVRSSLSQYTPLVQQLLFSRGITESVSAERFLNPNYEEHLHDPLLLTDMKKAVDRILLALQKNEHIVIYTDYDCDGIPGGVLLHDFFTIIGYTNFENYIPHRHYDGYGFNVESVKSFKERDTTLIITVDCGITDHEAVLAANALNIDVIVTDHHEPSSVLPSAYAIINPKRDDAYPFDGICGTTVAYKLVQAILQEGKAIGQLTLKEGMEKWLLDLVGLATVADMVPLTNENRVLAHYGLAVLRKSKRPGLQHLLHKAGGSQRHLTEDDIGFTIAPRINAASRMDSPEDAFNLLRTKDEVEAGAYASHLEKLNNERKGVVAGMVKEAKKRMSQVMEIPPVIVFGNPDWRPSLVGLVANTIAEMYKRPTFLWGRDGKGVIKGSCRSDGRTSIVALMESTKDSFITFGGHHASGGFSVSHDAIHTLPEALILAMKDMKASESMKSEYIVDAHITLEVIDKKFLDTLESFAPFGRGNPKPLFAIKNVTPDNVIIFGKTKNHTKLTFKTGYNKYDAISFFRLPTDFAVEPKKEQAITLLAHIERSYFMGRLETRLRIVDILKNK